MFSIKKREIEKLSLVDTSSNEVFKSLDNMFHCYWWDETENFGDWIGPWLVSQKTGKTVINTRNIRAKQTLFTVGSIIHHLADMDGEIKVWGSGLIKPIQGRWNGKFKRKMNQVEFLAVRGRLTQSELVSKVGASVPDIYGDPALLLPRYFSPQQTIKHKIVLCPHQAHYKFIKEKFSQYENILVIDVKADLREVITLIANAEICISSSLHGLIIAQAYNVPWVWLRFEDQQLVGDTFKFHDFYTTLKECNHDHMVNYLAEKLEYADIIKIADRAKLFKLSINLDSLDESFNQIGFG